MRLAQAQARVKRPGAAKATRQKGGIGVSPPAGATIAPEDSFASAMVIPSPKATRRSGTLRSIQEQKAENRNSRAPASRKSCPFASWGRCNPIWTRPRNSEAEVDGIEEKNESEPHRAKKKGAQRSRQNDGDDQKNGASNHERILGRAREADGARGGIPPAERFDEVGG